VNLFINAIGMVTALGHDAATSCAAIRAGITRAAPVPDATVLDPDSHTMVPLIGHAVWGLTEGRATVARWLAMATYAFNDLRRSGMLPDADDVAFWRRTAVVIVGPDLDEDRFAFAFPCYPEMIGETYVAPLMRSLGIPIDADRVHTVYVGRTGAFTAFAGAETLLARGRVDRLIVLAADSYLDGHSVEWLGESERLKSAEKPSGLMPGEAAVAMLVSGPTTARRSGPPRARIHAAAVAAEDEPYLDGGPKNGRALALALTEAVTASALGRPLDVDVYTDLNGESWRAYQFGAAFPQVSADLLQPRRFMMPAMSTGDVGAASSLAAVAVASHAFERGYARSASAIVTGMSASGRVGALVIGRG
jgi:3-oxoacyl-[acyl-carrier-protein] synthase-1